MIRRAFLFAAVFASLVPLAAVCGGTGTPVYFCHKGGMAVKTLFSDIDSVRFFQEGNVGAFFMDSGKSSAYYSLDGFLDSVSLRGCPGEAAAFPASGDFSVEFRQSDREKAVSVPETVVKDKDADEYGDFVENFIHKTSITITYSGGTATVSPGSVTGVKVTVNGAHVSVTSASGNIRYILKGTSGNGSFKISSDKKFRLDLSGLDLTNPVGPAVNVQSGKSVYVVLTSGTVNRLTDGAVYDYVADEDRKATLFSEGQLLVSGSGELYVTSLSAHGICSDDYIRFRSGLGKIDVTAAKDGINTKEKLLMYGGSLNLSAGDDGVVVRQGRCELMGGTLEVSAADNGIDVSYEQPDSSYVVMGGGYVSISTTGAKGHGMNCAGNMKVSGGVLHVQVRGDAAKAVNCSGDINAAGAVMTLVTEGSPLYNEIESDYSSAACIRCRGNFVMTDAVLEMKSTGAGGKGLNCDCNVKISGSSITSITEGPSFFDNGSSVRPRTIDCASLVLAEGTTANLVSSYSAVHTLADFCSEGSMVYAFSPGGDIRTLSVGGTTVISDGMVYTHAE